MTLQLLQSIKGKKIIKLFFSLCLFISILSSSVSYAKINTISVLVDAQTISSKSDVVSQSGIPDGGALNSYGLAFSTASNNNIVIPATFKEPVVAAKYAVLMDSKTGQVLYKKNENDQAYPASITKIMTALLVAENLKEDDTITMSHDAVYGIERDSSHIALQVGEIITMEQALNAILLVSANDAANGAAERVGGTFVNFAKMMTDRAKSIGAVNTQFVNAHGLPDDNHYTTAYDMALITREALKNETFRKYFTKIDYTMQPTNLQKESRYFLNHHKMLYRTKYQYKYAFAGKTGYTSKAGSTLVTIANKDGHELICVSLKESAVEAYADAKTLFEYGFSQFEPMVLSTSVYENSSIKVLDNEQTIGTAKFQNLQDQTIWIPKGSGCTPSMIRINTMDSSVEATYKNAVSNNANSANTNSSTVSNNTSSKTPGNNNVSYPDSSTKITDTAKSTASFSKSVDSSSDETIVNIKSRKITSTYSTGGFDISIDTDGVEKSIVDSTSSNNNATILTNMTEIALHAQIPELTTSFYEPAIIIPLQAKISLNPAATPTPIPNSANKNSAGGIILIVLKYIGILLLILLAAYLVYVLFMIFRLGYNKKIWKKIRKNIRKVFRIKKNRQVIQNENIKKRKKIKDGHQEIPSVRKINTPKDL